MSRRSFTAILALALGLGGLAPAAKAANTITFNPTGSGSGPLTAEFFDESPGNALAADFTPTVGSTFTLLYQAKVGTVNGTVNGVSNTPIFTYGGANGQLTVVASVPEAVTSANVSGSTGTATFQALAGGTVNMYFNTAAVASDLAGTGFTAGTLIYTGSSVPGPTGNFTSNLGTSVPLDQAVGGDQYPGINSVTGVGATSTTFNTTFANPSFFPGGLSQLAFTMFQSTNSLPFTVVKPAAQMFDGRPAATSVGTINGSGGTTGGRNVLFQADASNSFAIPEPSSVVSASMAVAVGLLCMLRRRRAVAA